MAQTLRHVILAFVFLLLSIWEGSRTVATVPTTRDYGEEGESNNGMIRRKLQTNTGSCIGTYRDLRMYLVQASDNHAFELCCGTINFNMEDAITVKANNIFLGCACGQSDGRKKCVLDRNQAEMRILQVTGHGITVRGIVFQGASNPNENGGAVYLAGTGTNTFASCVFRYNMGRNGGALYANKNGITILRNTFFADNVASRRGGAAHIGNGNRSANGADTRGIQNTAQKCDGVYFSDSGDCDPLRRFEGQRCIFTLDRLQAILERGDQSILLCGGTRFFLIEELVLTGTGRQITCEGTNCVLDMSQGSGRILRVEGSGNEIVGIGFEYGSTPDNGGAIIFNGNDNSMISCDFRYNSAGGDGGAIYANFDKQVSMAGCTFFGNRAQNTGGAMFMDITSQNTMPGFVNSGQSNTARYCNDIFTSRYQLCDPLTYLPLDREAPDDDFNRIAAPWDDDDAPLDDYVPPVECAGTEEELRVWLAQAIQTTYICENANIVIRHEITIVANGLRVECLSEERCVLDKQGRRGRIFNVVGNNNVFVGLSFRNADNTGRNGGAMIVSGQDNAIINCDFLANKAELGGGLFVPKDVRIDVAGSSFEANHATTRGGGAYFNFETGVSFALNNRGENNMGNFCPDLYNQATSLCETLRRRQN